MGIIKEIFGGASGAFVTIAVAETASRTLFGKSIINPIFGKSADIGEKGSFVGFFEELGQKARARVEAFSNEGQAFFPVTGLSSPSAETGLEEVVATDRETTGQVQSLITRSEFVTLFKEQDPTIRYVDFFDSENAANKDGSNQLNAGRVSDIDIVAANTRDFGVQYFVIGR